MIHLPASIWQDDLETRMPIIGHTRALRFIDIMRNYFDREIYISTDSLEAVALFISVHPDFESTIPVIGCIFEGD